MSSNLTVLMFGRLVELVYMLVLETSAFGIVGSTPTAAISGNGVIGSRAGFKSRWSSPPCGFESHFPYFALAGGTGPGASNPGG